MGSNLFEPKGEQAIWVPLYEHLRVLDYGQIVAYSKLDELVGKDVRTERGPIYSAMREMERHDHRTLKVVPKVGYAIALPKEHRDLSEKHRKRSYRQVTKARNKLKSVPRELLPEDELRWIDEHEIRLSQLESGLRHTNRRLSIVKKEVEVNSEKLAEIQILMDKLKEQGLI